MDLQKAIFDLRQELQRTDEVIRALENMELNRGPKHGRPPKYADSSRPIKPRRHNRLVGPPRCISASPSPSKLYPSPVADGPSERLGDSQLC